MGFIQTLQKLRKGDALIAGGKGASLGELMSAKIPVPPGFVLSTHAFESFLHETNVRTEIDAALDSVDPEKIHTVENASERIQALVEEYDIPEAMEKELLSAYKKLGTPFVAVRSSATAEDSVMAAWAGQLETYLNTTEKTLIAHVKKCWASLYSPRAIFYRFEKGFHTQKVSVAVVVQAMIESEKSGIAFSVHPVTQDRNHMIIEAGFGLGEAIVSGAITPDSIVVRKDTGAIVEEKIHQKTKGLFRSESGGNEWREYSEEEGKKPILSESEITKLSEMIIGIEEHYGFPVDVEWAFAGGKFYILQSRPITTLNDEFAKKPLVREEDYDVLFKLRGKMTCLHADLFVQFSTHPADSLVVFHDHHWHSYISRETEDLCQKRGLKIFGSENLYKEYADGFRAYISMAREKILPQFRKPVFLKKEDFEGMIKILAEFCSYYGQTEWFYHDLAYEQAMKTNDPVLLKNLKDLEILKIEGRKLLNDYMFEGGVFDNLLRGIAQEFLQNSDDAKYLFVSELLGLYEGKTIDQDVIAKRRAYYGCMSTKGVLTVFSDREVKEVWRIMHPAQGHGDITGVVTSKGKAKGRVVIAPMLVNHDEVAKVHALMQHGDILVAESTTPEIMSLCNKAAAIVTDQGGMLSHAAVVSRELKIPCIIGTGHATEILKNGDTVEVDSDNGVIRILSSSPRSIVWTHYLTRPFTLLGASLWREWYASKHCENALGVTNTEAKFLEVYPDVVRYYREKNEMEALKNAAKQIVLHDRKKLMNMYKKGEALNKDGRKTLEKGWEAVPDFESSIDLCIAMAIHATVVPFLTLALFDDLDITDKKLRRAAEELRAESLYPRFFAEIVTRHAEELAKKLGIDPKDVCLLTIRELRESNVSELEDRLKHRRVNERFVYSYVRGEERIEWADDIESAVFTMENLKKEVLDVIRGTVAYPGKATGRARLVLTDNPKGVYFDEGDILVSINSTPALMPLIRRCGAMVTDEGGISCHAAIVSRELKKPCVMSTRLATSLIKDGDEIEVDAEEGIVRIL